MPMGLTALAGINTIELSWDRNTEEDLKGYRIYRALEAGPFERLAELVEDPAYSDKSVTPGKKYKYAVSSIDQAGNESAKSTPVEITSPQ
jgi:fibronectin type 3 domain-containing protein